jgi:hippurate hydrolase
MINDAATTQIALAAAQAVCAQVDTGFAPSTAGDDFAVFAQSAPGAYVWLGNGPAQAGALHHNPGYDFNDEALPTGIAFWVEVARRALA